MNEVKEDYHLLLTPFTEEDAFGVIVRELFDLEGKSYLNGKEKLSFRATCEKVNRAAYASERNQCIIRSSNCSQFVCKCGKNYCGMTKVEKDEKYKAYCKEYDLEGLFCMPFGDGETKCECDVRHEEQREWCGTIRGSCEAHYKYCDEMCTEFGSSNNTGE